MSEFTSSHKVAAPLLLAATLLAACSGKPYYNKEQLSPTQIKELNGKHQPGLVEAYYSPWFPGNGQVLRIPYGCLDPKIFPNTSAAKDKKHCPTAAKPSFHDGINLAVTERTEFVIPCDGTVVRSEDRNGQKLGGYMLELQTAADCPEGAMTVLITNLDKNLVRTGDKLQAGQAIALAGTTNEVSQVEVGVHNGTQSVDPMQFLQLHR